MKPPSQFLPRASQQIPFSQRKCLMVSTLTSLPQTTMENLQQRVTFGTGHRAARPGRTWSPKNVDKGRRYQNTRDYQGERTFAHQVLSPDSSASNRWTPPPATFHPPDPQPSASARRRGPSEGAAHPGTTSRRRVYSGARTPRKPQM